MSELLLFFGRFHPLVVHLPIGLLMLLLVIETVAKIPRFRTVGDSSRLILALAVLSAAVSALFGWMLSQGGDYDPDLLKWHKWSGFAVAGAALVAFVFQCLNWRKLYHVLLFSTFGVLTVASHFGGSLTHGKDYLTEYAPEPLRALLGAAPKKKAKDKKSITDPEQAVLYTDLVQPILDQKCSSCHNGEKLKGGLRVDKLTAMLKGGKSGPAVLAGKATDSPLVKRVLLPVEDDKHMPPGGKPQLTDDELAIIQWWIDSGVSADKKIADLKPPVRVLAVLDSLFGQGEEEAPEPKTLEEILPVAQQVSADVGIPILPLAQNEPWLHCNASVLKTFGDAELAKLDPLKANIRWLNLAGTKVTDAGLKQVAGMKNLTQLHLERTAVTDAGLRSLSKLRELEYLNLYGLPITDNGLQSLKRLTNLQHLYLWQTKVSPDAAKALADEFVDKQKIERWQQQIENLEYKIKNLNLDVNTGGQVPSPVPAQSSGRQAPAPTVAAASTNTETGASSSGAPPGATDSPTAKPQPSPAKPSPAKTALPLPSKK